MEEARKVGMSEKEENTPALSGEVIMESFGSPEEEIKLNTPVPELHIIPYSSSYPPFFPQLSNPAAEGAKENVSGEGEGTEETRKVVVS